jgi:hypothetical protein
MGRPVFPRGHYRAASLAQCRGSLGVAEGLPARLLYSSASYDAAPAPSVRITGERPAFGEGAAPGWGKLSTPLPLGFPGRVIVAKPVDPTGRRSRKSQPRITAPALPRWVAPFLFCAPSPPRPLWPERRVAFRVSPSGVAKGRCGAPSRRLAGLVSFGSAGMRDCATPNPTRLPLGQRYPVGMGRSHQDRSPGYEDRQVQQGNSGQQTEGQTESETPAPASAGGRLSRA